MNPLKSITGTLVAGFVVSVIGAIAIVIILRVSQACNGILSGCFDSAGGAFMNTLSLVVWLHVLVGITWIGLLYYFNFVQIPAAAEAAGDSEGPGPAAISKYVAPRALLWFRWSALATWITGALALEFSGIGLVAAFTLSGPLAIKIIGIGAWLGTIMLFNVWGLIWPNQKKILGIVEATAEEIAKAKTIALMASRTNTLLSIPMIMCMVGFGHGLPFSF